jgi:hypothetical protein
MLGERLEPLEATLSVDGPPHDEELTPDRCIGFIGEIGEVGFEVLFGFMNAPPHEVRGEKLKLLPLDADPRMPVLVSDFIAAVLEGRPPHILKPALLIPDGMRPVGAE